MIYDFLVSGFMRAYDLFFMVWITAKNYFIKKNFRSVFSLLLSTSISVLLKLAVITGFIFTDECKRPVNISSVETANFGVSLLAIKIKILCRC